MCKIDNELVFETTHCGAHRQREEIHPMVASQSNQINIYDVIYIYIYVKDVLDSNSESVFEPRFHKS